MKKNILFIVVDSVTNDILFNKKNSNLIAPFLNNLRKKSISGDNMYSEAPYTEAALISLLASLDTMDNGGYMERMKNKVSALELFQKNGYKVFFDNYYPSIYPSKMVPGYDECKYIEGFDFSQLWEYRLKYFASIYENNELNSDELLMLCNMLDDNFVGWRIYLNKIKNHDPETTMLNNCVDLVDIDTNINTLENEYNVFLKDRTNYLKNLLLKKEQHALFKIKTFKMVDKVHNDSTRKIVMNKYIKTFKKIAKLNLKRNLLNNKFPYQKLFRNLCRSDLKTVKGLIAGYKNSLFDKDLYDRISENYDQFKNQRSFYTVSQEFYKWVKKNKSETWMSYIHIDDAHYNENFFTYDTKDLEVIDKDFIRINNYLKNIPKNYKGSIAYDLSLLYCDNIIKNIFDFLEKEKLLDNTAIVITADHGFSYYFSPVREKYVISSYKENYNVPFIVYSKDITPRKIQGYLQTKDIPSTLLSLANIQIPSCFKGKSLLTYEGNNYALLEYMGGGCPDIKRRPINLGVRTDNYFVAINANINLSFKEQPITEIYDLKKDPYEHNNLIFKKNIRNKIKKELELLKNRYNEIEKQYKKI